MNILIIDGNDADIDKTLNVFHRVRGRDSAFAVKSWRKPWILFTKTDALIKGVIILN
jgi:hypothetical protein